MSKYFIVTTSSLLGGLLLAFSGCGKGVTTDVSAAGSSNETPPAATTPGGGSITPTGTPSDGCPADQIAVYNFAQSNPVQDVFDLDLSRSSSILFVSVNGSEVTYAFDPNAGTVTISDTGQPGDQIQVEVCLPSPIGKPTGKPTGKPQPQPSCEPAPPKPTPSPSSTGCSGPQCGGGPIGV